MEQWQKHKQDRWAGRSFSWFVVRERWVCHLLVVRLSVDTQRQNAAGRICGPVFYNILFALNSSPCASAHMHACTACNSSPPPSFVFIAFLHTLQQITQSSRHFWNYKRGKTCLPRVCFQGGVKVAICNSNFTVQVLGFPGEKNNAHSDFVYERATFLT